MSNIVKIYGGLGNQLFQYAFGKAMQRNGIEVLYDISSFQRKTNPARNYSLSYFRIPHIKHGNLFSKRKIYNEVLLNYGKNPDYIKMDNCGFYGYWQHPSYFEHLKDELVQELRLNQTFYTPEYVLIRQDIILNDSVGIHVRRGDYITSKGHRIITMDYYEKAIELMKGKKLFVFSDDIPWCKKHFSNCTFINMSDYLSFDLYRLCKHQVIANSTFSWWGAYLNGYSEKIIVTPEKWRLYKDAHCQDDPELVHPEGWIRIDYKGLES